MKISEIKIIGVRQDTALLGFMSCLINDELLLENIGILTTKEGGFRINFPGRTIKNQNNLIRYYFRAITKKGYNELLEAAEGEIKRLGLFPQKKVIINPEGKKL